MKNLKAALKSSGRDGLSITLPASYWYLQHFDLVNLAKNVDWFNVMSYDLHGTWDQGKSQIFQGTASSRISILTSRLRQQMDWSISQCAHQLDRDN